MKQFLEQDKLGKEMLVEFTTIDPLSSQFSEKLNSGSDSLLRAYVPVEVQFVREFSSCLSKDKFLHSIEVLTFSKRLAAFKFHPQTKIN